jgi:CheY-like chemotaxis protein
MSVSAPNILVVDDEPQIRRVMRSTLTGHGYVILEAKTGEEAIEVARKEKPDLILLDVNRSVPRATPRNRCAHYHAHCAQRRT